MKIISLLIALIMFLYTNLFSVEAKVLTIYYSWSGNSEKIANYIASKVESDLLQVEVSTPYTATTDQEQYPVATKELNAIYNDGIYPSISTTIDNLDEYDTYVICYPLWHSHMSTPMQSFLNTYGHQMAGKKVALFCTSASSNISGTVLDARRLCPDANFTDSLWIRSGEISQSYSRVDSWLEENNINPNIEASDMKINIIVNNQTFSATLNDSEAAEIFETLLPLTLNMSDLNRNEKFFWLDTDFPGTATNPGMIYSGDLMIWSSNCLVLYYETFHSSYSFIKIGSVDDTTGLAEAVGAGNVTVIFQKAETAIEESHSESNVILDNNLLEYGNSIASLRYSLKAGTDVKIEIVNTNGQILETLVSEKQTEGDYYLEWNAEQYPTGMYFFKISFGNYIYSKQCIISK